MKYKRFIWFWIPNYYPSGGLGDINGSFDTLEEAITAAKAKNSPYDDNQIVDRDTWEIVWSS